MLFRSEARRILADFSVLNYAVPATLLRINVAMFDAHEKSAAPDRAEIRSRCRGLYVFFHAIGSCRFKIAQVKSARRRLGRVVECTGLENRRG